MKKRSKISKKIFKAILIIEACVLAAILLKETNLQIHLFYF